MVPWTLTGVILEHRARSTPWALLCMDQKQTNKKRWSLWLLWGVACWEVISLFVSDVWNYLQVPAGLSSWFQLGAEPFLLLVWSWQCCRNDQYIVWKSILEPVLESCMGQTWDGNWAWFGLTCVPGWGRQTRRGKPLVLFFICGALLSLRGRWQVTRGLWVERIGSGKLGTWDLELRTIRNSCAGQHWVWS